MAPQIQCAVSVVWRGAKHYQRKTSDRLSLSKTISLEAEIGSFMDDEVMPCWEGYGGVMLEGRWWYAIGRRGWCDVAVSIGVGS